MQDRKKEIVTIYDMMVHVEPVGGDATNEKFGVSKKHVNREKEVI